jgi:kynurenine formamidase
VEELMGRYTFYLGLMLAAFSAQIAAKPSDSEPHRLSSQDIDTMMTSLSNWGRWGKDDQSGTLNLITPEKRREAASEVKDGVSISLAHDVIKIKIGDSEPFVHRMVSTGQTPGADSALDAYSVQYHGYTQTHLDALAHVFYRGKMYNGFSQQEVTEAGANKLSVINIKAGVLTRGVLMDFPRLFGVKYLEGKRAIHTADLEAWEKKTGVQIKSGDAVLIRTGRWARWNSQGPWNIEKDSAGLDVSTMPWFRKHEIAVMGSDLALDVMPSGVDGVKLPVHLITIVAMGTPILDNCDLEALSEALAVRHRSTFLLTVNPLAVEGGTGSPVNPVATF